MTSGQGNNSTFSPFSQRAFMRHGEPVRADKRILQAKHQRQRLPVACASNRCQIAGNLNGNRAVNKNLPAHQAPSSAYCSSANRQIVAPSGQSPKRGISRKFGTEIKQLACESGASYQNPAPVLIGQCSYFVRLPLSTKSARRSQRTASASQTVQPSPPTPRADLAGALLSNGVFND